MNDDDEQVNAASPGSVRRPRDLVVGWAERCYARLRRPSPAVQARLDTLERVIGELRWRALEYSHNRPVNLFLKFARLCFERAEDLVADVYVAHGVQALPAAALLARVNGGAFYCDAIEIPSFDKRAVPSRWHPSNVDFLEYAFAGYLAQAAGVLTIGPTLGAELRRYNPRVHVIPNYRYAQQTIATERLREWCGLSAQDVLVLSLSTVASGFEVVIEALAKLPAHVHLATIGKFAPPAYADRCAELARNLGVASRMHAFEPVPYGELTAVVSGADVGLIVRDPAIANNRVSLPNRIFDYMFAGVPVCAPAIPDIADIISTWRMGAVVAGHSAADWEVAISTVLAAKNAMRSSALRAATELVWESLEEPLFAALGRPRSVCYLGVHSLRDNNRTMRMANSLAARGVTVTICSRGERADSVTRNDNIDAGIRMVTIELRGGKG